MDNKPANIKTWKVCYDFGEKITLKSNARFGVLAADGDKLQITGDDQIIIQKQEILSMDKIVVPIAVSAIRIRTKDMVIIVYAEWFHLTRYIVFANFQRGFQKELLKLFNS